jgi:hypothetical protein
MARRDGLRFDRIDPAQHRGAVRPSAVAALLDGKAVGEKEGKDASVAVTCAVVADNPVGRGRRIDQRGVSLAEDAVEARHVVSTSAPGQGSQASSGAVLARVGEAAEDHVGRDRRGPEHCAPAGGDHETARGASSRVGAGEVDRVAVGEDRPREVIAGGRLERSAVTMMVRQPPSSTTTTTRG